MWKFKAEFCFMALQTFPLYLKIYIEYLSKMYAFFIIQRFSFKLTNFKLKFEYKISDL